MAAKPSHLHAYLARYAEADALAAADRATSVYERALVIPCFDEPIDFLETLLPADAQQLLVVLVVNMPDNASQSAARRSMRLVEQLDSAARGKETQRDPARNIGVLVIDRVSRPIPRRQGVGLARKIGSDCAAALWQTKRLRQPWVYSTDADVRLPNGYFDTPLPGRGAALFPFRHIGCTPELQRKADLYELHLRYYKNRLAWAGSAYAFHTLGSTVAVHLEAYAMVRGYPRRNAGEDFYLLNKLAKVAPIHTLEAPTLELQARYSDRAPFGTGPALARMAEADAYTSYSPDSFRLLRQTLTALEGASQSADLKLDPKARQILDELGFAGFFRRAHAQYANPDNLRKAITDWFDGFRTLRFVHMCRRHYPDTRLLATLAHLYPALAGLPTSAMAQHFRDAEQQQRQVTTAMGSGSHKR